MAHDYKCKFFYDSSIHNIDEIVASTEEEIVKEELLGKDKEELDLMMNEIENQFKMPPLLFEDKGILYSLAQNPFFCGRLNKSQ